MNLGYTQRERAFQRAHGPAPGGPGQPGGAQVNTKLANLEELEPIYVYFNLNERDALQAAAIMRQRGMALTNAIGKTPVLVGLQTQEGYPQEGTLDFVDTGITTSSGTLQMRAIFANKDRVLIPGAFARVRIPLGEPKPMLVVPDSAIGNDQEGDYVLLAGAGDIVARRAVEKGALTTNGCAIRSGLTAEDRVIVNGIMRAKPGDKGHAGERTCQPNPAR